MPDKKKVLVVDDDESIRELIQVYLEDDYQVFQAACGTKAIELMKKEKPFLIILDIMLPQKAGWEVCKEIRTFSNIPIIMVSAKGEEIDRILGLELGADDYICKPFSPRELLARVKAQIRRSTLQSEPLYDWIEEINEGKSTSPQCVIESNHLIIDDKKYKALLKGQFLDLTTREFLLLAFLAKHEGQVFSREQLLQNVWGFDYVGDSRAVDSAVKRLRKKLNEIDNKNEYIHSVRSIGYKFEVADNENYF
ncbi:MAG TPA: response regulator transcription factor [Pseudobacteroides sp.]|uniref:response regulator transcription factor n=1 Tax=Pseudobacteroides sp. TaxID=1968840 RepID=UPI002F93DF24